MMKTISFYTCRAFGFLIILSFLGIGSCKKKSGDPDFCATTWANEVATELNAVTAAAQVYGTNPTTTNCNAYKAAVQNYLDALDPYVDCASWTAQQKNDLQAAIDAAEQSINSLCK